MKIDNRERDLIKLVQALIKQYNEYYYRNKH